MKRFAVSATLAVLLCACTVTPDPEPAARFTVPGNYRAVGECAFATIVRKEPAVRVANLESQRLVRVYFAQGAVYGWEADFTEQGTDTTVTIRTINFGRSMVVDRIRAYVNSCAS
ncbi:MAG: hypothetical protein K0M49_02265 [Arenimonas sp.]|nr:hypothetical protein [Rhizobium sp.]MBW8444431.1 hypothetical protein [Arenimonas sp.]